jgi:hypothetical protein
MMRISWVPVPSKSGFEMPFVFLEVWRQGFRSAAHCTGWTVGLRRIAGGYHRVPGLVRPLGDGHWCQGSAAAMGGCMPSSRAAGANSFW